MSDLHLETKIRALRDRPALTFAHKRDRGLPNQHSLHLNDHTEIFVFVSGSVHYIIEDRYYSLQRGDILVISPYSTHVPIIKEECVYERFYLLFSPDSLSDYSSSPVTELLRSCADEPLIRLEENRSEEVFSLLYRMSSIAENNPSKSEELLLHALAVEFLCLLNLNSKSQTISSDAGHTAPKLVREVLRYIYAHSSEITGIAPVANRFYVSKQYLATVFKKYVGVTVNDYLLTQKISVAKKLLEEGNTVAFTCYECGFNDCSYFIKVFKKKVGVTPNRYAGMTER